MAAELIAAPVLVTPATCRAVLGCSWDTAQRARGRLGLPLLRLGRQTPAIEVGALLNALRAEAKRGLDEPDPVAVGFDAMLTEARAQLRARLQGRR